MLHDHNPYKPKEAAPNESQIKSNSIANDLHNPKGLHVIYQQEFNSQDSGSLILKIQKKVFFIFQDQKFLKV